MSKSAIEQADEIVGIATDVIMANVKADTYRRGAYADWFRKNSQPDMWPTVAEVLSSQAERIVRLHAASKPKGDGLPDLIVCCPNEFGKEFVVVRKIIDGAMRPMTLEDQTSTAAYIQRCLTPPVRRLLAEFDVVESRSVEVNKLNTVMLHRNGQDICWLVPKGAK